jgi:transcriptional regulator with XRE-family HTH domain
MTSKLAQFKARAFARPGVKNAYHDLGDEFAFLDEVLKARAEAGLTQSEVAARVGTTQSAIARLESAQPKHSPSLATLQRYAKALGCKVEIRFVKDAPRRTKRLGGRTTPVAAPARGRVRQRGDDDHHEHRRECPGADRQHRGGLRQAVDNTERSSLQSMRG